MRRLLLIALLAAPVLGAGASVPSVQVLDEDCYYLDITVSGAGLGTRFCMPPGVELHIVPPPL